MLDRTTLKLFGKFPREVGIPSRSVVRSRKDLENFVINNNGINDCYIGLYPLSGEIDKISFDSDGKGALSETKQLYKNLISEDYPVIPVISGKKGFHIHIRLTPKQYEQPKEVLLNAQLKILEDTFGVNEKGELKCESFDSHVFGDVRRIFRIPNTLRPPENRNYCTYLPPEEFLDMTEEDIAEHTKSTHSYSFSNGDVLLTLHNFPKTNVKAKNFVPVESMSEGSGRTINNDVLKNLLRPCLYRHIITNNPRHDVRVASTIDLLRFGISQGEILRMYSQLDWSDFNGDITKYQINNVRSLRPYSCKTLIKRGIPKECCVS